MSQTPTPGDAGQARLEVRHLGLREYLPVWRDMQAFTDARGAHTPDELWLVQHPPVFTLGQAGRMAHVLDPGVIPVIKVDRGGQVTYHGPGQLVAYVLLDLRRSGRAVRGLVSRLEQSVIALLAGYAIEAHVRSKAPGVYVHGKKIAAVGLRVRRGCSFHGLSLNVNMDLAPFEHIDPCGYRGLEVTQLAALGGPTDLETVGRELIAELRRRLGYTTIGH